MRWTHRTTRSSLATTRSKSGKIRGGAKKSPRAGGEMVDGQHKADQDASSARADQARSSAGAAFADYRGTEQGPNRVRTTREWRARIDAHRSGARGAGIEFQAAAFGRSRGEVCEDPVVSGRRGIAPVRRGGTSSAAAASSGAGRPAASDPRSDAERDAPRGRGAAAKPAAPPRPRHGARRPPSFATEKAVRRKGEAAARDGRRESFRREPSPRAGVRKATWRARSSRSRSARPRSSRRRNPRSRCRSSPRRRSGPPRCRSCRDR